MNIFDSIIGRPAGASSIQYRIRKIVTSNKTGDVFGLTIPQQIAKDCSGTYFYVYTSGNSIILESGTQFKRGARHEKNYVVIR